MASSGLLRRVALVRTDVSEERNVSLIIVFVFLPRLRRLLVRTNVLSSPILVTLLKEMLSSCETSVLTRATRSNIPEEWTMGNGHNFDSHDLRELSAYYSSGLPLLAATVLFEPACQNMHLYVM
jgi:hypothetical protein